MVKMVAALLKKLRLLFLLTVCISVCHGGGGVSVNYSTKDCNCDGLELRSPGPGPRTLKVKCTKGSTVNCEYKGNPHGCSNYNNKGQKTFYQQALNDVGAKICSLQKMICPQGQIITKICGDLGDKNLKFLSGP